jgi:uracil-DNA glycosylase
VVTFDYINADGVLSHRRIEPMLLLFKSQAWYIWGLLPAGATYNIRGQPYYFKDKRVFPSYTPAGKNFLIEKSRRSMVAGDIREALKLAQ